MAGPGLQPAAPPAGYELGTAGAAAAPSPVGADRRLLVRLPQRGAAQLTFRGGFEASSCASP